MLLKLMYVVPEGSVIDTDRWWDVEAWGDWFWDWIQLMMNTNPDVNFFFVTITTDIEIQEKA